MNTGGSGCGKWVILALVLVLLIGCGAAQWNFTQQQREDQKFDAVAKIADKEADALLEQAKAIGEQAKAIGVQAQTVDKATDRIIEQSKDNESMSKGYMVMAGVVAFLIILILILLGGRRAPAA